MARAGQRSTFCEFLVPPGVSGPGEISSDIAGWTKWHEAWAKRRGLRGGELTLARETNAQTTEELYFDYADVMDPVGDGTRLVESMVIRSEHGELFDIDGVFPDDVARREVRVVAIRKRLPV